MLKCYITATVTGRHVGW